MQNSSSNKTIEDANHARSRLENYIQDRILTSGWPPGFKLPSEAGLGEQFGVSRTAVREAIRRLQGRGLLKSVKGSGTYVANGQLELVTQAFSAYSTLSTDEESFIDLLELRLAIEGDSTAKVAESHSVEDIVAIEDHMEQMARTKVIEEFAILDIDFHVLLLHLTKNQLFNSLGTALRDRYVRLAIEACRKKIYGRQCTLDEHYAIVDAIKKSDPVAARRAAREHVGKSRSRWST